MILNTYKHCLDRISQDDLDKLKSIIDNYQDIIILGNGGSNAISCHIAEDYTKALGKRALCFGDSARMSCYANDYGWDNAYTKYIEHFKTNQTLVILISSSGNSANIINAAQYCVENNIPIIILSGFSHNNKLNINFTDKSLLSFYVDSNDYGIVECIHELILHSII
jgi:D-sedoheptulose 7-phosphate isomerase